MEKWLSAFLFVFGAVAVAGENPVGLPKELLKHVAYYNTFDKDDWITKPAVGRFKVKIDNRNSRIVPGKGIRGGALQGPANGYGHFTLKGKDAALNRSRTYSIWIRYGDAPNPKPLTTGMLVFEFSNQPETNIGRFDYFVHGSSSDGHAISGRTYGLPGMEATGGSVKNAAPYPSGEWCHFVMTSNGQRFAWYANGKKVSELTLPSPLEPPYIFDRCDVGGLDAFLDEFVIFDIALTDEAVAEYHADVRSLLVRERLFD